MLNPKFFPFSKHPNCWLTPSYASQDVKALHQALGNTDDALAASLVPWTREARRNGAERGRDGVGGVGAGIFLWKIDKKWDIYGIFLGIYYDFVGFEMENLEKEMDNP